MGINGNDVPDNAIVSCLSKKITNVFEQAMKVRVFSGVERERRNATKVGPFKFSLLFVSSFQPMFSKFLF